MDELDKLLRRRAVPRCDGLEARILAASQSAAVMAFIMLPRPFLTMMVFLVFGLGLGLYSPDFEAVDYVELLLEDDGFGDVI